MNPPSRLHQVPDIVRIVITEATRRRAEGEISDELFGEQLQRVAREELKPRGLVLLARELSGGRTRFLIKESATGAVCELMEFGQDGSRERNASELPALPEQRATQVA